MKKQTTETWTKQDSEDASRLLAGMVRRAKNSSRPAGEMPAEIKDAPAVPRAGEDGSADSGAANGAPVTISAANENERTRGMMEG